MAGIETDIQFSGIDGSFTSAPAGAGSLTLEHQLKWFGTLRGRLGFLVTPQLLLFGTGGLAFGNTQASAALTGGNLFSAIGGVSSIDCVASPATNCLTGSASKVSTGSTYGAGIEWALLGGTTIKFEYLHVDLGDQLLVLRPQAPFTGNGFVTARFDNSFDIVRAGVNVRF